jgi:hypothetical protein
VTTGQHATATASSENSGDTANFAFEGGTDKAWICNVSATLPQWVAIDLGAEYALTSYALTCQEVLSDRQPQDWELQGNNASADPGETWSVIDAVTGETGWSPDEERTYSL